MSSNDIPLPNSTDLAFMNWTRRVTSEINSLKSLVEQQSNTIASLQQEIKSLKEKQNTDGQT